MGDRAEVEEASRPDSQGGPGGQPATPDEASLEEQLGWLLLLGVVASALVLLLGGAVYLARHSHEPVPDRRAFKPEPPEFSRPGAIVRAALAGRGRAIIQLGIVLLIATPILRVAYSVVAFARRRDRAYTIITLIVLAVLLYGLLSGHVHG
jgi:uncharacterized membrane protein